jgi:hypothetical protein
MTSTSMFITTDKNHRPISSVMDQYSFVTRTISSDLSATPEYILSAQVDGGFVVQKHFINASGNEDMLYYRQAATPGVNPRTVFEANPASFAFVDFWTAFA